MKNTETVCVLLLLLHTSACTHAGNRGCAVSVLVYVASRLGKYSVVSVTFPVYIRGI